MRKFFLRNAPDTVKAAIELSELDFLEQFKDTTASKEVLTSAYHDIRVKNQFKLPPVENKKVVFKVVQTDEKVVPITTPVKTAEEKAKKISDVLKGAIKADHEALMNHFKNPPTEFTGFMQLRELAEGEILTGVSLDIANVKEEPVSYREITGNGTITNPVKVSRGRRRLTNADQRDERILELLVEGKKGQDIIKIMKEEGFSVHAPQVTAIKQKWEAEEVVN